MPLLSSQLVKALRIDGRSVAADDVKGRVLVHDLGPDLRKGTILGEQHLDSVRRSGEIHVVELEPGDLHEDEAARWRARVRLWPRHTGRLWKAARTSCCSPARRPSIRSIPPMRSSRTPAAGSCSWARRCIPAACCGWAASTKLRSSVSRRARVLAATARSTCCCHSCSRTDALTRATCGGSAMAA